MAVLLITFTVMKIVFYVYNSPHSSFRIADIIAVIAHGLPQDLSTVSYLAVLPWAVCVTTIWFQKKWLSALLNIYYYIISPLLVLILIGDCVLYKFWQFKIDATIFNYLDSPKDIVVNVSGLFLAAATVAIIALSTGLIFALRKTCKPVFNKCRKKSKVLCAFVLVGGCMFLMIRGGVGRSTMNVGYVYYSSDQFLNHSAVNPAFSLIYSSLKYKNLEKLYHFYSANECKENFETLQFSTLTTEPDTLLTTTRPNVVLVLMEGLGATFVEPLGGEKGVTPNLNKLCGEGVLFSRCYANSYRTDRGTICTLSGYPAFPDLSVMKMPEKSMDLPSIARSLSKEGYATSYLYGGDKNFTNANSYLLSTGYDCVMGDEHFPSSVRHTHSWGVTDHIVIDTLYNQICRQYSTGKPFFITCQTLASHEDWQVPYHRLDNKKTNAMAYLDNCIGNLVEKLRQHPVWDNLLVIFIPDHGITYPENITEADIKKCHIPLLWIGGTIKHATEINKICNQTDLAATLLGQMDIDHRQFEFSRDVTSKTYTYPCAIHTFGRGVSFIDSSGVSVEDLTSRRLITDLPSPNANRVRNAHTILQFTVKDLSEK